MNKIKDISSISIGFNHAGNKQVDLFAKNTADGNIELQNISIVYGHNGAGKSTISRELQKFSRGQESTIKFRDKNNSEINLEAYRGHIFVFTEDYIEENFYNVETNGLNPIILVGDKAKIKKRIDELESRLAIVRNEISSSEEQVAQKRSELESKRQLHKNTIRELWRNNSRLYSENSQYKKFTERIFAEITSTDTQDLNSDELDSKFSEITRKIKQGTDGILSEWRPTKINTDINYKKIKEFLSFIPDNTENDDSELKKRLARLTTSSLQEKLESTFSSSSKYCSECFQNLTNNYKETTSHAIQKYIEEIQRENYSKQANDLKVELLEIPTSPDEFTLDSSLLEDLRNTYSEINKRISHINSKLNEKAEAPSTFPEIEFDDLDSLFKKLKDVHKYCENAVDEHNKAVNEIKNLREFAGDINNKLSAIRFSELNKEVLSLEKDIESVSPDRKKLEEKDSLVDEIEELRKSFNDTELATKFINQLLKIVFGNESMQLSVAGDYYEVKNRSNKVSPQHLSTGEKNILALCHFIANVFRGKQIFNDCGNLIIPNDPMIIIFDDPISSLDYDNKYGITSLINFFARNLFKENQESKISILTHDLSAVQDFKQIFSKMGNSVKYSIFNLKDGDLSNLSLNSDLYLDILKRMFNIATCDSANNISEEISHNDIRRLWEAFSRFELGEKITEVNTSKYIQEVVKSSSLNAKSFIDGFSAHAFINTDSHSEFQILSFNFDLIPTMSERELHRYIRQVLCFIHIISPNHIVSRVNKQDFSGTKEKMDKVLEETLAEFEIKSS
ncbi:AAA family ATPase [Rothia nasimurium]|uniref:AAA family ATPase n=1 Tax=Rothia nasimurium TaxID=85336 RepID=UPI001F1A6452|nr:AAA family ATPase [Rothia nasimurium]